MSELKPCPCGKTPTSLHITGSDSKWKWVSGNCCNEWSIEFRTGYFKADTKECKDRAREAWNTADRPAPKQEVSVEDIENIINRFSPMNNSEIKEQCAKAICAHFHAPDDEECHCKDRAETLEKGLALVRRFCPKCQKHIKLTTVKQMQTAMQNANNKALDILKRIIKSTPHSMCSDAKAWAEAEDLLSSGRQFEPEMSFKEDILKIIAEEEELDGEMPEENFNLINKVGMEAALRAAVRGTKKNIAKKVDSYFHQKLHKEKDGK